MLRAGLIGAGRTASTHVAALQQVEGVQVTALVDPNPERAQERAAQAGARIVPDLAALWEHVDAVWVCSPAHLHQEHAVAAARAGRHVFVERPLAHSLEAADQIIGACRQAGVRLMVGHPARFVPVLRRLRELVLDGGLGRPVSLWSRRFGETSPAEIPWWRRDWRRGGGFVVEWGLPELDVLRWIGEAVAGPVRRVHGRVVFSRPAFPELDDYARVTLTYDSGAVGGFEGGLSVPLGGGTTRAVLGTRAMALVEGRALRLRYTGDGAERLIDVPLLYDQETRVNAAVRAEDEEFVKAVEAGREPSVPGEAGRAALALCLAVHRSSREGQEIALEEAPGPPGGPGAQETPRS